MKARWREKKKGNEGPWTRYRRDNEIIASLRHRGISELRSRMTDVSRSRGGTRISVGAKEAVRYALGGPPPAIGRYPRTLGRTVGRGQSRRGTAERWLSGFSRWTQLHRMEGRRDRGGEDGERAAGTERGSGTYITSLASRHPSSTWSSDTWVSEPGSRGGKVFICLVRSLYG